MLYLCTFLLYSNLPCNRTDWDLPSSQPSPTPPSYPTPTPPPPPQSTTLPWWRRLQLKLMDRQAELSSTSSTTTTASIIVSTTTTTTAPPPTTTTKSSVEEKELEERVDDDELNELGELFLNYIISWASWVFIWER